MRIFTLMVLCLVSLCLNAQQSGLLTDDTRYEQVPVLPLYSGVKYHEIPAKISLKKYCPVPGDQKQTGACVGWAVGYGALTIQRAIESNITDQVLITQQANSAAFLYNQIKRGKADCTEGAFLEDGLELVKKTGDCLEQSFNYQLVDCQTRPEEPLHQEAIQYRIRDYAAVFALREEPKSKVSKICKVLATNTPVVVGVGVTAGFFELPPGTALWNPGEQEQVVSYHAMVVVGYNSVEKYVELLNSFGASWGQNGYIRIPFDDVERLCRYAFVMSTNASQPIQQKQAVNFTAAPNTSRLTGEFVFRQPAGYLTNEQGDELMYFEEIKTLRSTATPGLYLTEKPVFATGDVFQLVAREIPRGRFVYVFSKGPDGSVNQHFPRKKEAMASASFVLERSVEIVIPGEESLLQIPSPGDDYLCILYSEAPLTDFETRLSKLRTTSSGFPEQVKTAFQDVLIDPSAIQYAPDKMAFSAIPSSEKNAVCMFLKVTAQ